MDAHVYITSTNPGQTADRIAETRLRELHARSDQRYGLVEEPEQADVILVLVDRTDSWGTRFLDHEVIGRFLRKSYAIHDAGYPMFLLHGLYSSNRRSLLSRGRVRTGAYTLSGVANPFVAGNVADLAASPAKAYLFSYIGRSSHPVRARLLSLTTRRSDVLIEDSSAFNLWSDVPAPDARDRQRHYYDTLRRSKFALCPRGDGHGTMRLFEAMALGVSPVVISDGYVPPSGPDWSTFAIFVGEHDLPEVERIVGAREPDFVRMGRAAREAYERHFAEDVYFNYIVDSCFDIMRSQRVPETVYWTLRRPFLWALTVRDALRLRTRLAGWRGGA